jgi:hypothetical protein
MTDLMTHSTPLSLPLWVIQLTHYKVNARQARLDSFSVTGIPGDESKKRTWAT